MWEENHFNLFISHVTIHGKVAHLLKSELKKFYISCFVAHDDIEPTKVWQNEIERALLSMDALAALLTPDFHKSKWTDQEVGYAMGSGRLILPIRYGADPHGFIGKYQGYTLKKGQKINTVAREIVSILSRHPETSRRIASALVCKLENSGSFNTSTTTLELLEKCPVISEEELVRIEAASKDNRQVREAFGVIGGIASLARKHRQIGGGIE
jgi:hypothetical protein